MEKRKTWVLRVFWTAAAILWMALIFMLSSQTGAQSSGLSDRVCDWVGRFFVPGYRGFSKAQQEAFLAASSFYVRKAAHIVEYTVLGILLSMTAGSYGLTGRKRILLATVLGIGFAAFDEMHQLAVDGRAGQIRDVLIDSVGVELGIVISLYTAAAVRWGAFIVYFAAFLHFTLLGRTPVEQPVFEPHPFTALRRSIWVDGTFPELLRLLFSGRPAEVLYRIHILQTWSLRGLALNILLFIPMGIFLPALLPPLRGRNKRTRKADKKTRFIRTRVRAGFPWRAFLVCLLLSLVLEIVQYTTRLGAFDADDLLCNAIGALIGCILARIL